MNFGDIYNKAVLLSPKWEVLLRKIYWSNVSIFYKYRPNRSRVLKSTSATKSNFNLVIDYLRKNGVKKGSLLIVHSSYDALSCSGLSPNQVIDALLELIGDEGTLAMPVFRRYKEDLPVDQLLKNDMEGVESTYNVKTSLITTGMLPYILMKKKGSITSRFPLNPLTAYGPLAVHMMENNLVGDYPSPHGVNSSWKFCLDHDAIVVGLGLESGFLTISHVCEETSPDWPIANWYRERLFKIKDGDFELKKTVLERRPKWGLLYFAEKNNRKDLVDNKVLHEAIIDDIQVCIYHSSQLLDFLQSQNRDRKGYPYFVEKKYLKKRFK